MISLETWTAGVMMIAMIVYTLTGGADFGSGAWDLMAMGPRAEQQKKTVANAIAPIWEANHVWLIVVIVLLFIAFPRGFAMISVGLNIPLSFVLLGIVMRGSAFIFRSQFTRPDASERNWGHMFIIGSLLTPVFLGIVIGALAAGRLSADPGSGGFIRDFIHPWVAFFPIMLGLLTLSLFAFLAAVYLTLETGDKALQDDFRLRSVASLIFLGIFAWLSLFAASKGAPIIYSGLTERPWSLPFLAVTCIVVLATLGALLKRRFSTARILAVLLAVLILLGWGMSQYPHLVHPHLTIWNAAPAPVLRPLLISLVAGVFLLFPSFAFLYYIFKRDAFLGKRNGKR